MNMVMECNGTPYIKVVVFLEQRFQRFHSKPGVVIQKSVSAAQSNVEEPQQVVQLGSLHPDTANTRQYYLDGVCSQLQ